MLAVGDIQVYVSDFQRALRFWAEGLALQVAEMEVREHGAHATLDFPDGGPSIRLLCADGPWEPDVRPQTGARPTVRFDVTTDDFDAALVRLIEHGGAQLDEIETYNKLRVVMVADPDGNTFELIEVPGETQ